MKTEDIYYRHDLVALESAPIPAALKEAWRLSWTGDIFNAQTILNDMDLGTLPPSLAQLVEADRLLHRVKIGMRLDHPRIHLSFFSMAGAVYQYALYSHYFWIDHRVAWRALFKLTLISLLTGRGSMLLTSFFLIGHMLAIAGVRHPGLALATVIFHLVYWRRLSQKPLPPFASNIVYAAYPYTLFVAARLKSIPSVMEKIRPHLSNDPYYRSVFQVSCLYSFAYSADIVRTEIACNNFERLHAHGKLLRYQPISAIMALLPLALRGYAQLIEKAFVALLAKHDASKSDPSINSQFYRVAALLSLCLGENAQAEELINKAIYYRRLSRFTAWKPIDTKIHRFATSKTRVDANSLHFMDIGMVPSHDYQLSLLLIKLIMDFRHCVDRPDQLLMSVVANLRAHFHWDKVIVQKIPPSVLDNSPAIRVGDSYVIIEGLPEGRIEYVREALSSLAPALIVIGESMEQIRDIQRQATQSSRLAAIGQTTQMLAHDVRKPFSMISGLLRILESADDATSMRQLAHKYIPEVDKALANVNGMLNDIIQVGAQSSPKTMAVSLREVIRAALEENLRFADTMAVTLHYELTHASCVDANEIELKRVISNIVANALQAMRYQGDIVFASHETDLAVVLNLSNDGPPIAEDALPLIFEPFFTRGKQGGTGLGLAIAKKVVERHGGSISCQNGSLGPVFTISLPKHAQWDESNEDLLLVSSRDWQDAVALPQEYGGEGERVAASVGHETDWGEKIGLMANDLRSPLAILAVDDEALYHEALSQMVASLPVLAGKVSLSFAKDPTQALRLIHSQDFGLMLFDIDLADHGVNGLELAAGVKGDGCQSMIVIHSNRLSEVADPSLVDQVADVFLPKPLQANDLLKVVYQAMQKAVQRQLPALPAEVSDDDGMVLVVDDCPIVRYQWARLEGLKKVRTFEGPEAFLEAWAREPLLVHRARAIVLDHYFEDNLAVTGMDIARQLRAQDVQPAMFLASNGDFPHLEDGLFQAVIAKDPSQAWAAIQNHVGTAQSSL